MLKNLKFTAEELSVMSFFESMTGVSPVDCVIQDDTVILVVKSEDFDTLLKNVSMMQRKSRGALRSLLNEMEKVIRKKITIVKYYSSPEQFLRNYFALRKEEDIKFITRPDGTSYAIVYVNPRRKGAVIGKNGVKAKQARMLAKKYFNLQTILIK